MIKRVKLASSKKEPPVLEADRDDYLEYLVGELEINLDNLSGEMTRQPDMYYRTGRELARLMVYQDVTARNLRTARTRVDASLRRAARERGLSVVEEELQMQIQSHMDVEQAAQQNSEARRRVHAYRVLHWAFEQRADILLGLVQLGKK